MNQFLGKNSSNFFYDDERVALLDTSIPEPNVVLSGKPCQILRYLISSSNKVLSVSEIQQGVWGNTIVTSGSVKDYIAQIRAALRDSATAPEFVETIRGHGYRYLGGIATSDSLPKQSTIKPTLAILPPLFCDKTNHSFDMVGEIIAANLIGTVSRSPLINIISRLSTRQFKNDNADPQLIGKTLGADYLLSGLYHRQNNKLVLYIELSNVEDSNIVWADNISGTASEWSDENSAQLQHLTREVTDEIFRHQIDLTTSSPIETLALHAMVINAINYMHSSSQTVFRQAEKLLLHAITLLPDNATLYSLLAQWHLMSMNRSHGWNLSESSTFRESAFRNTKHALALNPLHSHANTIAGCLEARLNNKFETALTHHSIAMSSNPNSALNHCFKASASTYQEDTVDAKTAVYHAKQAIMLSPLDPQLYLFKTVAAAANQYAGNLEEARLLASESYEMNPNHTSNLRTLISVLIDQQKNDEARQFKDKLLRLDPNFTVKAYRSFGPGIQSSFGDHIAQNLEQAGVPVH